MSSQPKSLQDRFAALQAAFLQQTRERMTDIEQRWPAVRSSLSPQELKPIYIHVHSLCGSSSTLGFAEISEAAMQADLFLRPLANADESIPAACIPQIESLLETLRLAAAQSVMPG